MKLLVIDGSLKDGGQCRSMTDMLCEGTSAEVFEIFKKNINPCTDCEGCRDTGRCVISDDMSHIYKAIERADIIAFTSPVYFSSLTGVMLNFLSRLQVYYLNRKSIGNIKKKKALLLLCGGGATKRLDIPRHQLELALRIINCELAGFEAFMKADEMRVEDDREFCERINKIKSDLKLLV